MEWLGKEIKFPDPRFASRQGLLALGGDLSVQRLIFAYQLGVFPWYNEGEPILWWSPDPRFVLYPSAIKVSKSMRRILRSEHFEVRYDTAFDQVIDYCARVPREGQNGTWLIPEMQEAYRTLHQLNIAHSVETWQNGELVGGLYGIALGRVFYGESMFARQSNASKVALVHLARQLQRRGFVLIDCQAETSHLSSMGADFIPRDRFLDILQANEPHMKAPVDWGGWNGATWAALHS